MKQERIKILFGIGTLDVGGAERQLVELAGSLDPARFEPIVCVLSHDGPLAPALRERGVRVYSLGFTGFRDRYYPQLSSTTRALIRLWRIMKSERPQIFHGILFWAYIIGTVVARAARVPVVIASRRSLGLFKAGKHHYLFIERLVNRLTDLFIANSKAVRTDVIAQERVSPERIIVIYNGLDTTIYENAPDTTLRDELRLGPGPVVVVVSNFIHYKGHGYFFEAWRAVLSRWPTGVALLVGDGSIRGEWEQRAAAEGWSRSVRFLGVRDDVPRLLALSDLFVHPSLQEGYSNALLEAMAASLPIVATAVGGNVEAIEDGKTGLLVPPADARALDQAMTRLLEDRAFARQLGREARAAVECRHGLRGMARAYEDVYEKLACARPRDTHVWDRRTV